MNYETFNQNGVYFCNLLDVLTQTSQFKIAAKPYAIRAEP